MRRVLGFAAVGALLVAGIVVAVLLYNHSVHGAPWSALAIFLIGFAAVGAIALTIAHAYNVEQHEAHHTEMPEGRRRT